MDSYLKSLELSDELFQILSFLIKNKDQYDHFMSEFWKGKETQVFSVSSYRLHRIRQANVTYEDVSLSFEEDHIQSLESLFLQKIDKQQGDIIIRKINDGSLTLRGIYDKFSRNIGINISRFTHGGKMKT